MNEPRFGNGGPAVELRSLTRRFGNLVAVNKVTMAVASGSIFGLLGTNGAGKTAVIKLLTTQLAPTDGTALVVGIRELRDEFGTTIMMTTHDMDEADQLCEMLAFMHRGNLVAQGAPIELKARQGGKATLDDVFIELTGSSVIEPEDYKNVAAIRRTFQRLE